MNYNYWVTPIITTDNQIYASGSWGFQGVAWRGIVKLDTLGNLLEKFPIGSNGEFQPIDELFLIQMKIYISEVNMNMVQLVKAVL